MKNLILLRGNSGSGKTTTAEHLKDELPENVLYINQDNVRMQMISKTTSKDTYSISLMNSMVHWGFENVDYIIVEGILKKSVYQDLLKSWKHIMDEKMLTYYIDVSFDETYRRNLTKKRHFDEATMRSWWQEKDELGFENTVFHDEDDPARIEIILKDLKLF
ncbi:AAA family ATPase [Companilactobacillus hulinensis]|uniref:AAA family ATPase n=1 Tax=Companilactobacillus hulinensis TaxID=2486007 RepID=UPI000F7770B8|nr:AAA family ATPase [Companilactobacillus hulinensis]